MTSIILGKKHRIQCILLCAPQYFYHVPARFMSNNVANAMLFPKVNKKSQHKITLTTSWWQGLQFLQQENKEEPWSAATIVQHTFHCFACGSPKPGRCLARCQDKFSPIFLACSILVLQLSYPAQTPSWPQPLARVFRQYQIAGAPKWLSSLATLQTNVIGS